MVKERYFSLELSCRRLRSLVVHYNAYKYKLDRILRLAFTFFLLRIIPKNYLTTIFITSWMIYLQGRRSWTTTCCSRSCPLRRSQTTKWVNTTSTGYTSTSTGKIWDKGSFSLSYSYSLRSKVKPIPPSDDDYLRTYKTKKKQEELDSLVAEQTKRLSLKLIL